MDIADLKHRIDREITLFHLGKAKKLIEKGLKYAVDYDFHGLECYFRGELAMINEDFKRAVHYFLLAINDNQEDFCSWNDLGICFGEMGMYGKAFDAFDRGLAVNSNHRPLYQNKGWVYTLIHDHDNALVCFSKALELDPHSPESLFSCGDCFMQRGDNEKALDLFQRALAEVEGKSSFAVKEIKKFIKQVETQ